MTGVVVVGTGVAGVRAAEALSAAGYPGEITLIGDEAPVYRPSVSKEALTTGSTGDFPMPTRASDARFNWQSQSRVQSLDAERHSLTFQDSTGNSTSTEFEGLIIASGLRPRALPVVGPTAGRFLLRTLAQANALADQLQSGARITIVGSGFIGCEAAAAAAARGCQVTVISPEPIPLASAVGVTIGQIVTQRHLDKGVRFVFERSVHEYVGSDHITGVRLDDGELIDTDVVLEAVGSVANSEWLSGQGLHTVDGVLTDGNLRAMGAVGALFACGDIACHPNALFDSEARRIEHWTVAADTGAYAGKAMQALLAKGHIDIPDFAAVPSFWSDQYDLQIQAFGLPHLGTEQSIIELNKDGSCIIECRRGLALVGAIGINRTAQLAHYRKSISSSL